MPIYEQDRFGDLYVEYNVVLPTEVSPDMKRRTWFVLAVNQSVLT